MLKEDFVECYCFGCSKQLLSEEGITFVNPNPSTNEDNSTIKKKTKKEYGL